MPRSSAFDGVSVVSSLGGIEALTVLLTGLPAEFPASVIVTQHRSPGGDDVLPFVLQRHSRLPVEMARDGAPVQRGLVYVAPAHKLLSVRDDRFSIPWEASRDFRPGDVTMSSVAAAYGNRALGVVLTGLQRDGQLGVLAMKRSGGLVLVQDPATARGIGMPSAAVATGCADHVLPIELIGVALVALVMSPGASWLLRRPAPVDVAGGPVAAPA